jgi:hypothetical protein
MAQVCLVGSEDVNLRYELFSRETARDALLTYDLREPWENTLVLDTVSLGAAVSLLNDLNWYLVRFTSDTMVQANSVSEEEWLSRKLAARIRDKQVTPGETGDYLKLYGVADDRLVDPMFVQRTAGEIPDYDLREVEDTVAVRVEEGEFGG